MNQEDAEEYTQSLGQIVAGSWRQIALAHRLGVPAALGYKKADGLRKWVEERLGGYIKMAITERKEAVAELSKDHNNVEIGNIVGVKEGTVRNDLAKLRDEAEKPQETPSNNAVISQNCETAPLDAIPAAQKTRTENEQARKAELEKTVDSELVPGIYVEDFVTGSDRIADGSVDLVFVDPPYNKESVDLYRKAAKVAARILKPGGSFVAYSGQKYLPEVYGLINHPALRYWWTFAGVHAGANQMLQKLGIRCGWKPIVWYVKGTRGNVAEVLADVVTGAREKTHHEWQQAESEALHFIEKLTFPGGLVVDFFLGGGTTKVAADRLGRRFIGFEIDQKTADRAKQRILENAA